MKQTIFCIMGYTASGKDSIADAVSSKCGIPKVVSFTTRPKRENEDGTKHLFISEDAFEAIKKTNDFAAYTKIGDYHYFVTRTQLNSLFFDNNAVVYVIDPEGVEMLKGNMPDANIVTIYVNVSREECSNRAKKRGDNGYQHHKRTLAEYTRFMKMLRTANFDYAVKNEDISKAEAVVESIIKTEMRE